MKSKIKIFFKIFTFVFFLLGQVFVYGSYNTAQAVCNYQAKIESDKYQVTPNETFNIRADILRSGDLQDCSDSVQIHLEVKNKFGGYQENTSAWAGFYTDPKLGTVATKTFPIKASGLSSNEFATPNSLEFRYRVTGVVSNLAQSGSIKIDLSGNSGGSFSIKLNPLKALYSSTDRPTLDISADPASLSIPSSVSTIYVSVKNGSKEIVKHTVPKNLIYGSTFSTSAFAISSDNNFKSGANTLTVELYEAGTSTRLGQGTISFQVSTPDGSGVGPSVSVVNPKSLYALGDTVVLQFSNMPTGWTGELQVGTNKFPISNNNFSFTVDASKGFKDKQNNSITVLAYKQDKSALTLSGTPININLDPNSQTGSGSGNGTGTTNTTPTLSETLVNPLPWDGLLETFLGITKGLLAGLAIWAVIAIIISGFRMVLAAGNEEAIATAKRSITWAILGLVVAILSFSIVAIVQNLLNVKIEQYDPRPVTGYNQTQEPKNLI